MASHASLETIYVITIWSGGKAGRKWKSLMRPELLPQGTGVRFTSLESRLMVEIIGSISIEEYEQGSDLLKKVVGEEPSAEMPKPEDGPEGDPPKRPKPYLL